MKKYSKEPIITKAFSGPERAEFNFDYTCSKGASFVKNDLTKASFKGVSFEIQLYWIILLNFAALLLSLSSGIVLGAGILLSVELITEFSQVAYGILILLSLVSSLVVISRQGFLIGVIAGISPLIPFLLLSLFSSTKQNEFDISIYFFFGTSSIVLVAFSVVITALSIALVEITTGCVPVAVTVPSILTIIAAATTTIQVPQAIPIAVLVVVFSDYLSWKSIKGGQILHSIIQFAVVITAWRGNRFIEANLTDADFSDAKLKFCDFSGANLKRTHFLGSQGFEFSRLGNTYLSNPKIRQLVVTCNGQGKNFDGLDLAGVNLWDASLQDVNFSGASLNQSTLRGANLSRAILKQTQLEGADLTGAILTGAYIEDWGITSTTKLENVQCEYVYMRVPTKENPNPLRKPDNLRQTFAEGEFADFIQPFFDTLDLYHSQDVDPRAISIALRNLSAKHPDDDLKFVAMERRGDQGLNLRFTTTPRANKSELSHEYFASYAQIRKELPIAVQMQLAEQDTEIRTLKGTIEQFIQTGTHQSTIRAETIQVIQGELVVTENRDIKISAGDNANISGLVSGDGVVNLGTISGNVTNAINQLPDPSTSEQPNLKALLTQLQQVIQTDTSLPDPDKSDLLEQVQALAEAKQTEEPTKREGITRKAMKIFDATLKSLPDTAKIVETCGKLLPLILKALGLPV